MSLTLAESGKRFQNPLVAGVAQDIVTVDRFQGLIPNIGIAGNAITVNREDSLGNVEWLGVNAAVAAKTGSAVAQTTFTLTRVIGEVDVDMLQQVTAGSAGTDLMAMEISMKAKALGREVAQTTFTGSGASNEMNGLAGLVDASMVVDGSTGTAAGSISFESLDKLVDKIDLSGQKFIMMGKNAFRGYKALLRSAGGVTPDTIQLGGISLPAYDGVPIFVNDFAPTAEVYDASALTGGDAQSVYCGVFDDGSRKLGLAMLYPEAMEAGIAVDVLGMSDTYDAQVARVKRYLQLALFNRKGLARLHGIKTTY